MFDIISTDLLGTELTTTTYGKVYNGITDGETCRQTESEPINLLEVLGTVLLVVSSDACFWAMPCARFSVCLVGLVIRTAGSDCTSSPSELVSQHGCHFQFDGS